MSPPRETGGNGAAAQTPKQMARRARQLHHLPQASAGSQGSEPENPADQRIRQSVAARKLNQNLSTSTKLHENTRGYFFSFAHFRAASWTFFLYRRFRFRIVDCPIN